MEEDAQLKCSVSLSSMWQMYIVKLFTETNDCVSDSIVDRLICDGCTMSSSGNCSSSQIWVILEKTACYQCDLQLLATSMPYRLKLHQIFSFTCPDFQLSNSLCSFLCLHTAFLMEISQSILLERKCSRKSYTWMCLQVQQSSQGNFIWALLCDRLTAMSSYATHSCIGFTSVRYFSPAWERSHNLHSRFDITIDCTDKIYIFSLSLFLSPKPQFLLPVFAISVYEWSFFSLQFSELLIIFITYKILFLHNPFPPHIWLDMKR